MKSITYQLSTAVLLCSASFALSAVKPAAGIRAIVGEAAGCSLAVKIAVADAIQNRGTLRGVYGLNAAHNASEPPRVWADAARAWRIAQRTDPTAGATHFGNAADVAKGTFTGLQYVCTIGRGNEATFFYRDKRAKPAQLLRLERSGSN